MKLSPNDDALFGFDPTSDFISQLPSYDAIQSASVSSFYRANFTGPDAIVGHQTDNAMRIVRHSMGMDAINIGIFSDEVQALGEFFRLSAIADYTDEMRRVLRKVGDMAQDALRIVLDASKLLMDLAGALEDIATRVPVLGWVLKLAVGLFRLGKKIYKMVKEAKKEKDYEPPAGKAILYNQANDEAVVNTALAIAKGDDWTRIFLPSGLGSWNTIPITYTNDGFANGVSITQSGGREGWLGCFPQLAEQFIDYQYPQNRKIYGGGRMFGGRATTGTTWHPSVAQLSMLLWQRVLRFGPRMFSVRMNAVRSQWQDFFAQGFDLARRTEDQQLRDVLRNTLAWAWWKPNNSVQRPEKMIDRDWHWRYGRFNPHEMPSQYLEPVDWQHTDEEHRTGALSFPISFGNLIEYVEQEIWRPQAEAALKTLACAYTAPNAPALREDSKLAELHREMRKLLLQRRSAFMQVELDMVPDAEYRHEVELQQRHGFDFGAELPDGDGVRPGVIDGMAALVRDVEPPMPPGGLGPGIDGDPSPDAPGSSGTALLLAAGLGLGALLLR